MATVTGRSSVSRYLAAAPERLARSVLRGAGKAAVEVIADEAKLRCVDKEVAAAIKTSAKVGDGVVTAKVLVKGPNAYRAPWIEYGTAAHYISVDDTQRQGMSVGRINKLAKSGTLVINGKPVGKTVFHPGARPFPFLRPALDVKRDEAIAAAQSYVTARTSGRKAGAK